MKKVVSLILNGVGLRRVLAGEGRRRRDDLLVLPKSNGNEELIERCFELLKGMPPEDYASLLISVVNANAPLDDRMARWLPSIQDCATTERTRWMKFGLQLAVLSALNVEQLHSLFPSDSLDAQHMSLLMRSAQYKFLQTSERTFQSAIDCILDKAVTIPSHSQGKSVIATLGQSLNIFRYGNSFVRRQPIPLRETWRFNFFDSSDDDSATLIPPSFVSADKVKEFLETAATESVVTAREWATELGPWERLIEKGRLLFGERWAFFSLASVAAGIRSKTDTGGANSDIFLASNSLCQRSRFARLKAGNPAWWSTQLGRVSSELEEMFILLMLLTWAGPSVLSKLLTEINARLQSLPAEAWQRVYEALQSHMVVEEDQARSITELPLVGRLNERTVVTLAARSRLPLAETLYHRYLTTYDGEDAIVLEFCQKVVLKRAQDDPSTWKQTLKIISRSYAKGAVSDRHFGHRFARRTSELPVGIAQSIIKQADMYPSELVGLAELVCRSNLAPSITPVGEVAKRDGWFRDSTGDLS